MFVPTPKMWNAIAGARVDDPRGLPRVHRTRRRILKLRQVFLADFGGYASSRDLIAYARRHRLLAGVNDASAGDVVRAALEPIARSPQQPFRPR